MSGYCLECGNDLCICSELEEEAKKQPDVVFICQRKEIEKLQEENKILREALEFYAENKNWEQRESGSVKLCAIDPVDHFQHVDKWGDVFWIGGKRASEALAKVKE